MALSKAQFTQYIKQFDFRELFNHMGWNNDKTKQPITVESFEYTLQAVAEKSGFKILVCSPNAEGLIPDNATRKKIETKVTKLFQEHLIIFTDSEQKEQIWLLAVRKAGSPVKITETRYHITQDPELLFQRAKGVIIDIDEEEKITIVDVTQKMGDNFSQNIEKVTKKFYDGFKKQHTTFLAFIKGIDDKVNKEWYASLMLNRLMFCYFIQKKGFLDKNHHYLRDKLNSCKEKKGENKFYSFYRNFLLVLFHSGLNEPAQTEEVKIEIGRIPYLNGGLFDVHELETTYNDIDIDDKAFESIFIFFDEWEWHLDTRIAATGRDINPDVIGYIFEKYINDRAQMGAYYTKEDITEYISKNCILPYLFDEVQRNYPQAFAPAGEIWQLLKLSGDTYIYDAVKKGINPDNIWGDLPPEIEAGLNPQQDNLVELRKAWNVPAPAEAALPTEIWREVIERRNRYKEVKAKIEADEITHINDFITYNFNIRQFTQNLLETTNDPKLVEHFYKALCEVTIIDPTCGSGAFLFAAMNILEPLYEACIARMRAFTEDEDRINAEEQKKFSHKHKFFRTTLEHIQNEHHPNQAYFIYKSIILSNLYGVDIMKEAVEIAKLRLFLKMVATVEVDYRKENMGLEPLPDIDFNIRAGNALIGFATEEELKKGLDYTFDGVAAKPIIEEKCDIVAKAFSRYKEIQLGDGDNYKEFKKAKEELNNRLKELNEELSQLLHKQASSTPYKTWLENYKPFHWFAEFYEIIHDKGGFDIVIGNPPYVEYSNLKKVYQIKNFKTEPCGNLYAYVTERAIQTLSLNGFLSFIIPSASVSTPRMETLLKLTQNRFNNIWISVWDERPSKLFDGVDQQLSIHLYSKTSNKQSNLYMTNMIHWSSDQREQLFSNISYQKIKFDYKIAQVPPKIQNNIEATLLETIHSLSNSTISVATQNANTQIYYKNAGGRYWRLIKSFSSYFNSSKGVSVSSTEKNIKVNKEYRDLLIPLFSSSLFYWYWRVVSNCRHLTDREIYNFPLPQFIIDDENLKKKLEILSSKYENSLLANTKREVSENKSSGRIEQDIFFINQSKPIIDEIDTVLAEHYSFTPEELDYVINYDIKYRMGKELESDMD